MDLALEGGGGVCCGNKLVDHSTQIILKLASNYNYVTQNTQLNLPQILE